MCKWFAAIFGFVDDKAVRKQLEILRENEERLLEERENARKREQKLEAALREIQSNLAG